MGYSLQRYMAMLVEPLLYGSRAVQMRLSMQRYSAQRQCRKSCGHRADAQIQGAEICGRASRTSCIAYANDENVVQFHVFIRMFNTATIDVHTHHGDRYTSRARNGREQTVRFLLRESLPLRARVSPRRRPYPVLNIIADAPTAGSTAARALVSSRRGDEELAASDASELDAEMERAKHDLASDNEMLNRLATMASLTKRLRG